MFGSDFYIIAKILHYVLHLSLEKFKNDVMATLLKLGYYAVKDYMKDKTVGRLQFKVTSRISF